MKNKFVNKENAERTSNYIKDQAQEKYIAKMNEALEPLDIPKKSNNKYPTIFLFGLPRSGTTISYQLICNCLDLGYINNLIARFWSAPSFGIMLSKSVLFNSKDSSYISDYGKSIDAAGPHEFAYFWHKWLKMNSVEDMTRFGQNNNKIDWRGLNQQISSMQELFEKGMIFKTMFVANHLEKFINEMNMPIIIYIERDPYDVSLSILKARKAYYGDYNKWWSTHPPNYKQIFDLDFDEQIAQQVSSLREIYNKELSKIDQSFIIRIKLRDFCSNPLGFLESINLKIKKLYGLNIELINQPPQIFNFRTKNKILIN